MSPLDSAVLERKKNFILKELKLLEQLRGRDISSETNIIEQYALCRSIQNALAAVIDAAQHIVTQKTGAIPDSYAEAIRKLGTLGVLEEGFAERFSGSAKLRNVMVHLYEELDIERLVDILPQFIKDLKVFLKALKEVQ